MTKIALQLYSVRDDCAKNFPEVLKKVAEMGYEGVEFAGYYKYSAADLKKILDDLGIKAAGTHIGLETLLGDELKKTIEFNQAIGNKFLIVPGLSAEHTSSRAAWLETAKLFNDISTKVRAEGMYVGYHNHTIEFKPLDGECPWDTFYGAANPEVVMQLDLGNAMHGGVSADTLVDLLKRYPGRARSVHMKEYSSAGNNVLIGEGEVKWKEVITLCQSVGNTEWYVIEQESYAHPPMDCVKLCLANLKALIG